MAKVIPKAIGLDGPQIVRGKRRKKLPQDSQDLQEAYQRSREARQEAIYGRLEPQRRMGKPKSREGFIK